MAILLRTCPRLSYNRCDLIPHDYHGCLMLSRYVPAHFLTCPKCRIRIDICRIEQFEVQSDRGFYGDLRTEIEKYFELIRQGNKNGESMYLAHIFLDVLFRRHQHISPDSDALLIEQNIERIAKERWLQKDFFRFTNVFRSRYLDPYDRGDWSKDRYFNLIILTMAMGVSSQTYPMPFELMSHALHEVATQQFWEVYPFYRAELENRERQEKRLERAKRPYLNLVKSLREDAQQIELQITQLQRAFNPPDLIEEETAALKIRHREILREIIDLQNCIKEL